MSEDKKVQVDMAGVEVELVISALNFYAKSIKEGRVKPHIIWNAKERIHKEVVRTSSTEDVMKLSDKFSQGMSGRGGKDFGIYKLGKIETTEQEKKLLTFSLNFLLAGHEEARRKLLWEETKDWSRQLIGDLEEKLNQLGKYRTDEQSADMREASEDKKVQVHMTWGEVELVIDALNHYWLSLEAKRGRHRYAKQRPVTFLHGREEKIEKVVMLSSRLTEGSSGRGGEGFGIYKIGNIIITEQERHLLTWSLKLLAADDDQARRKLRVKETKEWDGDFVWNLKEKLDESG